MVLCIGSRCPCSFVNGLENWFHVYIKLCVFFFYLFILSPPGPTVIFIRVLENEQKKLIVIIIIKAGRRHDRRGCDILLDSTRSRIRESLFPCPAPTKQSSSSHDFFFFFVFVRWPPLPRVRTGDSRL